MRGAARRLAVIGAGPAGLEAAVRGLERGWEVTVLEKDRVGAHLLKWGHVRFFTPARDNASPILWKYLKTPPNPADYLTGAEFVQRILLPALDGAGLRHRVREGVAAAMISRRRLLKSELPNHPLRHDRPFQILTRDAAGGEAVVEADVVLDASGVFGQANWSGESGLPCPGERSADGFFVRHLPDIAGAERAAWRGRPALVIGDGHSAATAVGWLADLAAEDPRTEVHWVVPTERARPCLEAANDSLPERRGVVQKANDLAEHPPSGWRVYRRSRLVGVGPAAGDGSREATIGRGDESAACRVSRALALTGYRPDVSFLEELQVRLSPVTGGAAGLAQSLLGITDCLSPVVVQPENLDSGEKNFHIIGHKSYGRLTTFLLRAGWEQLDLIFKRLDA